MSKKILIIISAIALSFIIRIFIMSDVFKIIEPYNLYYQCQYLSIDIPSPEDIVHYKENIYFVAGGMLVDSLSRGKIEKKQCPIFEIQIVDDQFKVRVMKLLGFPTNIALYIHGIYIFGDQIYAINHAYNYGGERVEVFSLDSQRNIIYQKSILMEDKYMGSLNDLIVVNNTRFLTTVSMPYPDPKEGRSHWSLWHKLKLFISFTYSSSMTYVLDCLVEESGLMIYPDCIKLESTKSSLVNGITWNKKETVWVADSLKKEIVEYQLIGDGLKLRKKIKLDYSPDNIEYEDNRLIIGLAGQRENTIKLNYYLLNNQIQRDTEFEQWYGVGEINLENDEFRLLMMDKNLNKGLSGAVIYKNYLMLGSWCDISVMVCLKKQQNILS